MSIATDIADEIVTTLNAGDYSVEFTASRKYVPGMKRADVESLDVTVVTKGVERSVASRESRFADYAVDIALRKIVDATSVSAVDALMDLAQEIDDSLVMTQLDESGARWVSSSTVLYDMDAMYTNNLFVALVTVTYRVKVE